MLSSLVPLLALLAVSSATPIDKRDAGLQLGVCLTVACPNINGLTLTTTNLPSVLGGDLNCIYVDASVIPVPKVCTFAGNGLLNSASSDRSCIGFSACRSCSNGFSLAGGQCVAIPDVTTTITPTIISTVTQPVATTTPTITNTITGTNTVSVTVAVTVPNPLAPVTTTKTVSQVVTSAASTVTGGTVTKTVTTGTPTNTQYKVVFPTDCCPDAYLSLSQLTATAGVNLRKRANTITVTAPTTVTSTVTNKVGTLTAAAATVKVTVPAAKVTASVTVTAKQQTVTKTSTVVSTVTGVTKTVTATATTNVPNTGTFTSTITTACPTAGVDVGLGVKLGSTGINLRDLSPAQQAVQTALQGYQKLSAGLDVLVLCGSKLFSLKASA